MSKWLLWVVLLSLTGSPWISALVLLAVWFFADRATFRLLPDPVPAWTRWRRSVKLEDTLVDNPSDRRARAELAELWLLKRRYADATALLRANVEEGDDDAATLLPLGVALYGTGQAAQAEKVLAHALEEVGPGFRTGAILLEQGRWRLAGGDAAGARTALEAFLAHRPGSVEGRTLLARALELGGDAASAERMRGEAWRHYAHAPRFVRRAERRWAWRARPLRPATYALVAVMLAVLAGRFVAPSVSAWAERQRTVMHQEAEASTLEDAGP